MKKWFLEVVQDFDGSYYANLTIDAIPVKGLPEYVDYKTLKNAIKEQTGIVILNKNDMKFQQNGRKKYAYIDATQNREDCRVTLDEMYQGWEPNFDSVWITVYKDTLGYQDDNDNLTEILVPAEWLEKILEKDAGCIYPEDFALWFKEYTADWTIDIAQKALADGVIQACIDENVCIDKDVKFIKNQMLDVSEIEASDNFVLPYKKAPKFGVNLSLNSSRVFDLEKATIYEKAAFMVDDLLSERDGEDLFYIANVYYSLSFHDSEEDISREELLKLTEKIVDASYLSSVPLLTAERVDAVNAMLEFGITAKHSQVLPELTPEQAKKVLLNCELEEFCTIVDQLAVDNHHFYEPDKDDITDADIDKVEKAVVEILREPMALENAILNAEAQKEEPATCNKAFRVLDR